MNEIVNQVAIVATSSEYDYARDLVFFGFMCGLTAAALIAMLAQMFTSKPRDDRHE